MSGKPIDEAVSVTLHSDRAGCEWFIVTSKDHPDSESEVTPSDDPALFDLLKALTAAQQQGQAVAGEDDALTLADVAGVLGEIAEGFDGGEYAVSDETRRVLIDFANGLPEHPLFNIVGHYFAQHPAAGTAPPSAPVGVENIAVELEEFANCPGRVLTLAGKLRALAQQPAAVDEAMVMVQKHDALILADFAKAHGGAMEQLAARRITSLAAQHQEPKP